MNCTAKTATGKPCRGRAMIGSDPPMCPAHVSGSKIGRPLLLTDEVTTLIETMLRAGNYVSVAATAAGVSHRVFDLWMQKGESGESPYAEFRERIEHARAEGEARNVTIIATAAKRSWQAAAWLLERQHPERWGRPTQRVGESDAPPAVTDPLDVLDANVIALPQRTAKR